MLKKFATRTILALILAVIPELITVEVSVEISIALYSVVERESALLLNEHAPPAL